MNGPQSQIPGRTASSQNTAETQFYDSTFYKGDPCIPQNTELDDSSSGEMLNDQEMMLDILAF